MSYFLGLFLLLGIQIGLATAQPPDTVNAYGDYLDLALQYEAEGDANKAVHYYVLATIAFKAENNGAELVYVYNRMASLYSFDPSTYDSAAAYLDSAKVLLDERLHENDTLQILTWNSLAVLSAEQNKLDDALNYYQQALKRKRALYGENHLEEAFTLEDIGSIYLFELQNPHEARPYLEKALKIREELKDKSRNYFNDLYLLSVASRLRTDHEEALAYGFLALHGYENLPEPSFRNIISTYSLLGSIYLDIDSLNTGLNYNAKAIQLAKDKQLAETVDMSLHYNNQAEYLFQAKAYDSSLHYAQLAIAHQAGTVNLANSYQFLGNAYWGKGQLKQAFKNYRKSKTMKESFFSSQHAQLTTLYIDMGRAFETIKEIDSALYYYRKALRSTQLSQSDTDNNFSVKVGDDLATMEEVIVKTKDLLLNQYAHSGEQKYLKQAFPYFRLFDNYMDISRRDFSSEGSKLLLSGKHKATYEEAIFTCFALYQDTRADSLLSWIFHFMEKNKAMVLLESIHQTKEFKRSLPDSLFDQDQSLSAQLAYYQSELGQDDNNAEEIAAWQLQKAEVLQKIDRLNQVIQARYPNFYNITYRDISVGLDSLQKQMTKDQATVSYFWGESFVLALCITRDTVKVHQVKDVNALKRVIGHYYQVLAHDNILEFSYANFIQYQESALKLYQVLLAPFLDHQVYKSLTIVPDGDLTTIPFDSFVTSMIGTKNQAVSYEKLTYLIKEYEITYEFSLSIAAYEQEQKVDQVAKEDIQVTAFGIKNFDHLPGNKSLPPLGGAEREVRYVQDKFPRAQIFLNAEATESQFKQQAPQADLLHIATHGLADMKNPFASSFIFYPDDQEDGIFNLYELYDMPLKAKILLLSSCESGVGKHYAGEGNFSLARSFVYAGTQSVVMSLWQVNDIITEAMIRGVYDLLAREKTISTALRETKLSLINQKAYAHPQCWAGMVPLGNASIEKAKPIYVTWIMAGIGLLILIAFLSLIILRYRGHSAFRFVFSKE